MNVTDELQRLLDERGIEWSSPELSPNQTRLPNVKFEPWGEGTLKVTMFNLTPEQAIAATLGDDDYELKMDELLCRLTNGKWSKSRSYSVDFMVACVDEAYEDAALGGGECECDGTIEWQWTGPTTYYEHELSCGHVITSVDNEPPKFCEECGAKVRKAVGR